LQPEGEDWAAAGLRRLIRHIYMAFLNGGELAVDVGVNEGRHLVQMAQAVAPSGKIIGVEA
jgi:tRNA G46 methylase TrmB